MHIRLLQWNVWYKEDIEKIGATIKTVNPDIACLQELTIGFQESHPDTIAYLSAELGDFASFHEEMSLVAKPWVLVNAIFSRFPLGMQRKAWINETIASGEYDDEYRSYIETTLEIEGKSLKVANVHMSYTKGFIETERKKQETDKLYELIKDHDENFLLLGDLNALPDSFTIETLLKKLENAGPDFNEKTWTTKPFVSEDFEATSLDWRLDYIFKTPDIKVVSAEVVETDASDHLPILITIEI
jgi:endonuclease/exonuclease/phosphatase family metal-dependent hydrolase